MLSGIITAVVTGLGGILLTYLAQQRAQADHDKSRDESSYIAGQVDATVAEKDISNAAKTARDSAPPDFTALR